MRKIGKKLAAFAVAIAMVATLTVPAAAEQTSYETGKVYTMDENEFNAKGDAPEGYEWDYVVVSPHVDGYYDTEQIICGKEAHTHASATADDCQGWVLTCQETEHTHSDAADGCIGWYLSCEKEDHTHSGFEGSCYDLNCTKEGHTHTLLECRYFFGWRCGKEEHSHDSNCYTLVCTTEPHTHSDYAGACYTQKTCDIPEHVHTDYAGVCYTQNVCEKTEHTHTDDCYVYVDPVLAVYKCQLIPTGSTSGNNGDKKITAKVTIVCDGTPANGVPVTASFRVMKGQEWAVEYPTITLSATTGLDGVATFNVSSTYDYVTSVTAVINGQTVTIFSGKEWISNYEDEAAYSYNITEHNYVLDKNTVKEATLTEDGYTGDSFCSYCGDKKEGEIIPRTGVDVSFTGTKNNSDKTVAVKIGTTFGDVSDKPVDNNVYHSKVYDNGTKFLRITFDGWDIEDAFVLDVNATATAQYKEEADTDVTYFMLKPDKEIPNGTDSSSSDNFTKIGQNSNISADATVTTDSTLLATYFNENDLYGEGGILAGYTRTLEVGGQIVTIQKAEVFRTMYLTGTHDTDGWHADCYVKDIAGNIVNPDDNKYSYVFFCNEDGTALLDEENNVVYRVVEKGSDLTDLPTAPVKEADTTYTYSFDGWYDGSEKVDFASITADTLVVTAGYNATAIPVTPVTPGAPVAVETPVVAETIVTLATPGTTVTPVTTITEEETPLAPADEVVEIADEGTPLAPAETETAEIGEEETPLAVSADAMCYIHWIILILTLLFAVYSGVRGYARHQENAN